MTSNKSQPVLIYNKLVNFASLNLTYMKRFLLISILSLTLGIAAKAQSVIVTNDGDAIKAYNIEVTGNSVYYQKSVESDSPIQKINKSDILIIKMEDGSKLDPNAPEASAKAEDAPVAMMGNMLELSGDVAARNAEMIEEFNKVLTWEPDEKFLKKHQGKIGNGYAGIMWIEDDSQLYNGEVTISYQRLYNSGITSSDNFQASDYRSNSFFNPLVVVKVRNNTNKTIYLDLANCFTICGDDSSPYYIPVTTTVTNTSTNSQSKEYSKVEVENGKVRGNDRSYSSENTSSVVQVKEAVRFISVPPKSTMSLDPQPICKVSTGRDNHIYSHLSSLYMSRSVFPFRDTRYGDIYELAQEDSPFQFATCVSYSFNQDNSDARIIRTEMYLKYFMCTSAIGLFPYTIEGDFHRRYPFWVPFYVAD